MRTIRRTRLGALAAALALSLAVAPAALAQGESTPGALITAVNPGNSKAGSDLVVTLVAHSEQATDGGLFCRPQDLALRCWGSLILVVPSLDGLIVATFEVHRVAVGDITCGDEGGCEDEGGCDEGGGCEDEGGCEEGGSCGDGGMQVDPAGVTVEYPVKAQVNGLAVVIDPGSTDLARGAQVQVKVTLTDNGTARYADQVEVVVNQFVPGSVKPEVYRSGPQVVQQVQVRLLVTS